MGRDSELEVGRRRPGRGGGIKMGLGWQDSELEVGRQRPG